MKDFQIRVIARACITRCDQGESDIQAVVGSYNLPKGDSDQVLAYVYSTRPDIEPKQVEA
ncbi:hypothetical protein BVG16_23285 [Paenibacillus selenitireducens]|uniref:Uncharacterized protein n=1 Tax=Paenibacillus selenitireducens TaxID=1324314 RepID=A0A1T2X460_9BACL|nr:hypothetical protein [Paenibacillus selenitireducens]OPA74684.1 hypothetical protein BVG16_23285 [Paenibacillus selenitireducens]